MALSCELLGVLDFQADGGRVLAAGCGWLCIIADEFWPCPYGVLVCLYFQLKAIYDNRLMDAASRVFLWGPCPYALLCLPSYVCVLPSSD